ncbi:hypothetical protein [Paractinoplanes globisporus]|uniref:DUF1508 domain-containing protein n=1 Tax=Paractinoplanes globisporus TaxID=113565 RepID=A0ABW6WLT4_9ACTN|nr:hypothetical protein [Actinoplanes globisporus]
MTDYLRFEIFRRYGRYTWRLVQCVEGHRRVIAHAVRDYKSATKAYVALVALKDAITDAPIIDTTSGTDFGELAEFVIDRSVQPIRVGTSVAASGDADLG